MSMLIEALSKGQSKFGYWRDLVKKLNAEGPCVKDANNWRVVSLKIVIQ